MNRSAPAHPRCLDLARLVPLGSAVETCERSGSAETMRCSGARHIQDHASVPNGTPALDQVHAGVSFDSPARNDLAPKIDPPLRKAGKAGGGERKALPRSAGTEK
jgi:hypothetical protein